VVASRSAGETMRTCAGGDEFTSHTRAFRLLRGRLTRPRAGAPRCSNVAPRWSSYPLERMRWHLESLHEPPRTDRTRAQDALAKRTVTRRAHGAITGQGAGWRSALGARGVDGHIRWGCVGGTGPVLHRGRTSRKAHAVYQGCGSSAAHTGRGRAPPRQTPTVEGAGLVLARAAPEKSHTRLPKEGCNFPMERRRSW
jgi:hypothetical protein